MKSKCIKCAVAAAIAVTTFGVGVQNAEATSVSKVSQLTQSLVADLTDISTSAKSFDTESLAIACNSLNADSTVGLSYTRPKRIKRIAWQHFRNALQMFEQAGSECEEGATNLDTDKLSHATSLMTLASDEITQAQKTW